MNDFKHEYDLGKAVQIIPKKRHFKMLVTPRYIGHYHENIYEEFTADLVSNITKDGVCFIDVGAHYGFYSLLIGSNNKNSKIIAFEPVPETFSLLVKNVELNELKNIEVYNLAISDRDETKIFNITEASDSAGFYQHPLTSTIKTMEVKTLALDNFLKDLSGLPIVVKIDTEGHELHVLEGMRKIIEEVEDVRLVVEFNPSCLTSGGSQPRSLLEKIDQLGFEIFFIDDQRRQTYKLGDNIDNWASLIVDKIYVNLLCIKKHKSLSISFFSHSSQILGGAERSLLELTRELIRDHGVVCCVVLPNDGPLRQELGKVGASTLVVDYSWWCDASLPNDAEISSRLSNSFKAVLEQTRELKKINFDIVFTNTLVVPWGAITAFFLGRPHVWFIHELGKFDHDFKFYLPFRSVLRIIKDSSNLIFTNSNAVRKALFGEPSEKNVLTIYYNIDIPPEALNQGDGSNYFSRRDATKLLISGNIAETKGQEDAILAVKDLVDRKKDVELIIMGPASPSYLKELEQIVRDENLKGYVRFREFKENPYPVVNQADIVLMSSRREAFGRVTIEAMLLKKPVIGTNSGGTPELIREGHNGLLYEPGDYRQLADKIEYLIEHREKMREFGENGFEFAKATFTKEKYGGEVHKRLTELRGVSNLSSSPFVSFVTKHLLNLQTTADAQIAQKEERLAGEIAAHVREQERLAAEIHQLSAEKDSQIAAHVWEQERLAAEIGRLAESCRIAAKLQEKLEQDLQKQRSQIHDSQQFLIRERAAVEASRKQLDEKEGRIASLEALIQQREATLSHIYNSHGWKILTAYYELRNKALPANTKRRELAKYLWECLWKIVLFTPSRTRGATIVTRHSPAVFTRRNFSRALKHAKTFGFVKTYQKVREKLLYNWYAPQSTRSRTVGLIPIVPTVIKEEDVAIEEVTVSVVIPTKNGGEDFRRVLATIANQKGFRRVETIVVDSGSTDKTVELAEQFGAKIIKILPEKFTHSYARNLGASYATGEYLLFTVQDALPPSDLWLYELYRVIKSNNVVAVSCAEFPWESADLFYRAITWNHYRFLEVDREDRIMRYAGSEDHVTLRKNGQLSDLACLISKDVFAKYKYKTDYAEDLDLGLRLIKDGHEIAFLGSTRIIHSHNRPAFYYLKRGYVENVFLPRIFPDYPTMGNSLERVIPDVLFTHQVIRSMVEERTWDLQFPCKTDEFSNRILEKFQGTWEAPSTVSTEIVDGHLFDIEFQDFLGRLAKDYPVASSDARPGDGDLREAVQNFTKMILAYMGNSYEFVDDHIAEEFRLALYKTFAYQCGAKLAQCSLRNDYGDRRKLEQIHGELTRGV